MASFRRAAAYCNVSNGIRLSGYEKEMLKCAHFWTISFSMDLSSADDAEGFASQRAHLKTTPLS